MTVHAYASRAQYADHLTPIFEALPAETRGTFRAPRPCAWGSPGPIPSGDPVLVASYSDARALGNRHPLIYAEHGAGQTYPADPRSAGHGAYSGGDGLDRVRLFLCPSETVAARWRRRYPNAATAVVGSPRLDRYHGLGDPEGPPTIGLAFHHQGGLIPENGWAMPHYRPAMAASVALWRARGFDVVGHGHPTVEQPLRRLYGQAGVRWVDYDTLFHTACVLAVDNSSIAPEFAAATGRPLAWLNAPWYRLDRRHGGRFWDWPRGQVTVDDPHDLVESVLYAILDPCWIETARARMVWAIYGNVDGQASIRAAAAIEVVLSGA